MVPTPPSICSSSAGSIAGMVHGSLLVRVLSLGVMVWSLSSWPSVRCLPEGRAADSAGRFVTPPPQDTVRGVARGRFPCRGGRQRRHAMRCRLLGDFNFEEAPAREAAGADGGRGQVTAWLLACAIRRFGNGAEVRFPRLPAAPDGRAISCRARCRRLLPQRR